MGFPWGLQSEPDMRRAQESCSGAGLLLNMRKGEPKVVQKTGRRHSRGECKRPGAATRCFIARAAHCRRAPRSPCNRHIRLCFPVVVRRSNSRSNSRMQRGLALDRFLGGPRQSHRVGDSSGTARWASEHPCQAKMRCWGKSPLTAKSLSANPVYHGFAFPSPVPSLRLCCWGFNFAFVVQEHPISRRALSSAGVCRR